MYGLTKHFSLLAHRLGAAFVLGLLGLLLQIFARRRAGMVALESSTGILCRGDEARDILQQGAV